jgi:hypothetical protein
MQPDTTTLPSAATSRRGAKPLLRRAVLALSAVALAACGTAAAGGTHPTTSSRGRPLPTSPPVKAMLLDVAKGCPKTLDGSTVRNTGPGLADTFVPGKPTAALVCRYSPALYRSTHLDAAQAQLLAETIDRTALGPKVGVESCPMIPANPGGTVIAFSIPGRADVDIWYADYGCRSFTNGVRTADETANVTFYDGFMPLLDRLSPPLVGS